MTIGVGAVTGWFGRAKGQAPEADSFTGLLLGHLDAAHNLARWIVKDAALAEDVVQDAIVRALRYRSSYDGGDARAWLLRIVRHVAYDTIAAAQRRRAVSLDEPGGDDQAIQVPDPADDPEDALARKQDKAALAAALAALAADLRECVLLRDIEGLSYKEIAAITGVPVGTVMSRLWRARQGLMRIAAEGAPT